jgi:hypothetical protein
MKTTIVEQIKKTLGNSWNGVAINGTPFTQWMATEEFFSLWREKKEEIKNVKYSLYKHDVMGWVVTFFGAHEGQYASYDDYKKNQSEKNFKEAWGQIMGWVEESRDLSFSDKQDLIEELHNTNTMRELVSFVDREAENPEAVWEMIGR